MKFAAAVFKPRRYFNIWRYNALIDFLASLC